VTLHDAKPHAFTTELATAPAGLYRVEFTLDGVDYIGGWVVFGGKEICGGVGGPRATKKTLSSSFINKKFGGFLVKPAKKEKERKDTYMTSSSSIKNVIVGMRWLFIAEGILAVIAGFQLFVLTNQTDRFFAWTVSPALTAAFFGATYWPGAVMAFIAARKRVW